MEWEREREREERRMRRLEDCLDRMRRLWKAEIEFRAGNRIQAADECARDAERAYLDYQRELRACPAELPARLGQVA